MEHTTPQTKNAVLFTNFSDLSNSQRYYERPMMLNAWTQTCDEFGHMQPERQSSIVKELMQTIGQLEQTLRGHSELLSQFNTSKSKIATPQYDQQQYEMYPAQTSSNNSQSVLNPMRQASPPVESPESVKYTIIAQGHDDATGDPIEIQLTQNNSDLNLNSSSDDGSRLQICLSESEKEASITSSHSKRRKIAKAMPELLKDEHTFHQTMAAKARRAVSQRNRQSLLRCIKDERDQPNADAQNSSSAVHKMNMDNIMVSIGPNNTRIPAKIFENMMWTSASIATRKLLMSIFDRNTLATHSMTGKPSPAFKDLGKPLKQMLDPLIVQDIIFAVTHKCNVSEKEVRNAITTKCADENKMMKQKMYKNRSLCENKENVVESLHHTTL